MINHISDTSAWVAYYRMLETLRSDSLFKDSYAELLLGNRAEEFAKDHSQVNTWVQWTVVMRTHIIDQMIFDLIKQGVKTFVNVGAGLDSRPYRLKLGQDINWIEIDFPHVIDLKTKILKEFVPNCKLESIGLDLSDREKRQVLFKNLADKHERIVVLTEGVLPYLTELQVSELSEDLIMHKSFSYWICEYISPVSYKVLKDPKQMKSLEKSPFKFFPAEWNLFFEKRGWKLKLDRYYYDVSVEFSRPTPFPVIFKIFSLILGKKWAMPYRNMTGYLLWERNS